MSSLDLIGIVSRLIEPSAHWIRYRQINLSNGSTTGPETTRTVALVSYLFRTPQAAYATCVCQGYGTT